MATREAREGGGGNQREKGRGFFSLSVYSSFYDVLRPGRGKEYGKNMGNHGKTAIKKPPRISERILLRFLYRKSHTFSSGGGIWHHNLINSYNRKDSASAGSLFPVPLVCLALCLTMLLGVSSLISVVFVLGSAGHARGFLFRGILSDFHCSTSLWFIIAHYKIKIKIKMVG